MSDHKQIELLMNRLRMRQLALLLAIDEHRTLGAAASSLGMTQPAATKMLHELEQSLGQQLFERVGRTIQMNAAGRCALLSFRGMRGTLEQLHRELHELKLGGSGRVSVGSIMAASPTYLTGAIEKLMRDLPLLSINIAVGTSDELMGRLDEGELDAVIGRVPPGGGAYIFRPLAEEDIAVVCAPGHPLAKVRNPSFEQISQFPWVFQQEGSPMREVVAQEFREHHAALPRGLLETSSTLITVHLISRTQMISALPQSVAKGFSKKGMLGIVKYRMRNRLASYGSVTRSDRPMSEQAAHFLQLVHKTPRADW